MGLLQKRYALNTMKLLEEIIMPMSLRLLHKSSSFIPFNFENISLKNIETTYTEELQTPYNIVIESDRSLAVLF